MRFDEVAVIDLVGPVFMRRSVWSARRFVP